MNKFTILIPSLLLFSIFRVSSQSLATYDISFNSTWNAGDHTSIPGNAHWSKLVGATHKTPNTFLQIDQLATTGIKNIAETGNNTVFSNEVSDEITKGEADQYINGPNLGTATGKILISNLAVKKEFPLLTLVSMIAPSPDWIIALNSYNLLDTGENWKTSVTLDLFAYDAGTDDGPDYTSENMVTKPFMPISMINDKPINGKKMGTLTIKLKTVLNTENLITFKDLKVYPNPVSSGKISIGNLGVEALNKVEIFNISGLLVKSINEKIQNNILTVDIPNFPSGMYFLKLVTDKNKTMTQKFVIE